MSGGTTCKRLDRDKAVHGVLRLLGEHEDVRLLRTLASSCPLHVVIFPIQKSRFNLTMMRGSTGVTLVQLPIRVLLQGGVLVRACGSLTAVLEDWNKCDARLLLS
jgi:hypothetical protein